MTAVRGGAEYCDLAALAALFDDIAAAMRTAEGDGVDPDRLVEVAAVVVNGPRWRVHAPFLGREALRTYLEPAPAPKSGKARSPGKQRIASSPRFARR